MFQFIMALLAAVSGLLALFSPSTGANEPPFIAEIPAPWAHQMTATPPEPPSLPIPTSGAVYAATAVSGCPAVIIEVFGPAADAACAVSSCETGGKYSPLAHGAGDDRGLFQIIPFWHHSRLEALFAAGMVFNLDYFDPYTNTVLAYGISSGGTDWFAWTCQPNGELKTWNSSPPESSPLPSPQ